MNTDITSQNPDVSVADVSAVEVSALVHPEIPQAVTAVMAPEPTVELVKERKKPGRKPLPPEERARRRAEQRDVNAKRQEARRYAMKILSERHPEEFEALLELQLMARGIS